MRTPPCKLCCSTHHLLVLQDHIHQMGSCLLQMDGHEDPSVHTTLQRLTSEAMTLVAQLVRTHGKVSGPILHNGKTPGMDEHMHPQPNDAFYARILVRVLSLQCRDENNTLRPSAWVRLWDALETGGVLAAKRIKLKVGRGRRGGEGAGLLLQLSNTALMTSQLVLAHRVVAVMRATSHAAGSTDVSELCRSCLIAHRPLHASPLADAGAQC